MAIVHPSGIPVHLTRLPYQLDAKDTNDGRHHLGNDLSPRRENHHPMHNLLVEVRTVHTLPFIIVFPPVRKSLTMLATPRFFD